ncbi:hypothetical protein DNTS_031710 [Danionella cerebrum]|uniref:Protein ripply2 n=1 Tax=Danionella cerebrum TaxID=2873325 RepID=A0A553QB65_9TELE|nr:hypothetical protein DNTS_031710 [Danionella translucida]
MENMTLRHGLNSAFITEDTTQPWRPWVNRNTRIAAANKPYERTRNESLKVSITHPVKLFWPKSRCFDYLYQDAELLLRNYPVQATICLYEDSESEDEEDEDDLSDEDDEKQLK